MANNVRDRAKTKQLHEQKIAVGDGGEQYSEPNASQSKLRDEVCRGAISTQTVAPTNPNWQKQDLYLPEKLSST
ncbi:phage tail protein [Salmonella enterica]|uniref:phage tail-collar fiber domain-containing protein n=1 Tax=Salmonella enterica TaxID=28901 RepID=UPI00398C2690